MSIAVLTPATCWREEAGGVRVCVLFVQTVWYGFVGEGSAVRRENWKMWPIHKTSCTWTKELGKLLVLVHSLCSPFHYRSTAPSKASSPPRAI